MFASKILNKFVSNIKFLGKVQFVKYFEKSLLKICIYQNKGQYLYCQCETMKTEHSKATVI